MIHSHCHRKVYATEHRTLRTLRLSVPILFAHLKIVASATKGSKMKAEILSWSSFYLHCIAGGGKKKIFYAVPILLNGTIRCISFIEL